MDQATIFATTETKTDVERNDRRDRDRLQARLAEMGTDLSTASFERAYVRVTKAEEKLGRISDSQLETIVDEVISGSETLEGIAESFR